MSCSTRSSKSRVTQLSIGDTIEMVRLCCPETVRALEVLTSSSADKVAL